MDLNYFVCTLGQAGASKTEPKPYQTVSEFLLHQSKVQGHQPAVGFPIPHPEAKWSHRVLSFRDIHNGVEVLAERLSNFYGAADGQQIVALLCHSSPEFLFSWLALMRLGYSVLLLAPQCEPSAILHLCRSCNVSLLLYDIAHSFRAKEAEKLRGKPNDNDFAGRLLPFYAGEEIFQLVGQQPRLGLPQAGSDDTAIAYLHHTSGTSSGLPKPIPQSHRAAIGVLPHLPQRPTKATFTTTPLYHGGIADLFRAWTSDALIWLFPGKDVPITSRNICRCLDVASDYSQNKQVPEVKYFSSVPYVLQMMEADSTGLELLNCMDIVGVGGAALPAAVGERLVNSGTKLISRFGSAECGFILSSYREFSSDTEWQYLRNANHPGLLRFERREGDLFELIIRPGWPHIAKMNRDDGSFATADLFVRHLDIEDAWLYHSRADSQLTLITGKKFDPAPLEAAIASSDLLDDVLVFGNSRPYPGALLLRSEKSNEIPDKDLIEALSSIIDILNKESQDHARLSRDMLIPVPHQSEPLEKSSKGTILRRAAEARFEAYISSAYDTRGGGEATDVEDEKLPQHMIDLIQSIVPNRAPLREDTDLFSYGVDSLACMRLRNHLCKLTPRHTQELPLSIVEDCGTVQALSEYIKRKRQGIPDINAEDAKRLMLDLVKQLSSFQRETTKRQILGNGHYAKDVQREVVVLTGATGALGAYILDLLRKSNSVGEIYCLVRGADEEAAKERVSKALAQKGFAGLCPGNKLDEKIRVLQAELSEPGLGITETQYDDLARRATLILHVAWTVNFRINLTSFAKDNLPGVKNLIDLALAASREEPPRFAYCSSTAAIVNEKVDQGNSLIEVESQNPTSASPLGYGRSKWVAEKICSEAHRLTALKGRIACIRVGQLSGDSNNGIWNTMEAWPMMLSTARLIGCLPDLPNESLDWLPVDTAANAFLEAAQLQLHDDQMHIYHILNPHQRPTWHQMLQWLKQKDDFDIVSPQDWIGRLENSGHPEHPAMKLLGLWKETYGRATGKEKPKPRFSITKTKELVPALKTVRPVDEAYVYKIWDWVQANVH